MKSNNKTVQTLFFTLLLIFTPNILIAGYSIDSSSTIDGHNNYDNGETKILRLTASLSGSYLTLKMSKNGGGSFSTSGNIYFKVGSPETYGTNRESVRIYKGNSSKSFKHNLDSYSGYPKTFYARYESDNGGWAWAGPIRVTKSTPQVSVSSVSPTSATLKQSTTFMVKGSNLPSTTAIWIDECRNIQNLGGSSSQKSFRCTPSYKSGSHRGEVYDKTGTGKKVLKYFSVNFIDTGDTIPPQGSLLGIGSSYTKGASFYAEIKATDNKKLKSITFNISKNTNSVPVASVSKSWSSSSPSFSTRHKVDTSNLNVGRYNYSVWIKDDADNHAEVGKGSFSLTKANDTIKPTGSLTTTINNRYEKGKGIVFGIKANDNKQLKTITLNISKSTSNTPIASVSKSWSTNANSFTTAYTVNTTHLDTGAYSYSLWVKDKAGNALEAQKGGFTLTEIAIPTIPTEASKKLGARYEQPICSYTTAPTVSIKILDEGEATYGDAEYWAIEVEADVTGGSSSCTDSRNVFHTQHVFVAWETDNGGFIDITGNSSETEYNRVRFVVPLADKDEYQIKLYVGDNLGKEVRKALSKSNGKDTDGDGIADIYDIDDDNDGLTDYQESKYRFLNPLVADANQDYDNDGISNLDEINNYRTNPAKKDTDGDGLNDNEDAYPLDPTRPDQGNEGNIQLLSGINLPDMTITPSLTSKVYKIEVQNKTNQRKYITVKIVRQSGQEKLLTKSEFTCSVSVEAGKTGNCSILLKFDKDAPSGKYPLKITGTAAGGANFTEYKTIQVTNSVKNRNYSVLYKAKASITQKLGDILDHAPVVIQTHGDGDCTVVPYKLWLLHTQTGQKQIVSSGNANACQREFRIDNAKKTKLTKAGIYRFWAEIYPSADSNASDNKSPEMTIIVDDDKKSNLTITSLNIPSTAKVNELTSGLTINVKNIGAKTSTATRMGVYISNNSSNGGQTGLSDKPIASFNLPVISANGSKSFTGSFKAPQAGKKWIYSCISATANELNKTNNCSASKQITIMDAPKYPDLEATSYTLASPPKVGQAQNVSMIITNKGQKVSVATTIGIYTSSNSVKDVNDSRLTLVSVPAIPSGASKTVSGHINFTQAGDAWLFSCVGPVAGEQNTANNCTALKKVNVTNTTQPSISSITPTSAIYGENTTFTIQGSNLPNTLALWIDACTNMTKVSGSSNAKVQFRCTPSYSTGSKSGVIKDRPSGTALKNFTLNVTKKVTNPTVTSVSPSSATLNEQTTFTVQGSNLPSTLALWIDACTNMTKVSGSSNTKVQFRCTPSYSSGSKSGVVKDRPSGTALKNFTLNVTKKVTNPTVISVSPSSATLNEQTTFTVQGSNLPSTLALWIDACTNVTKLSGSSSTKVQFHCTPSYSTGSKNGVVKDKPSGTTLKSFILNVANVINTNSTSFKNKWRQTNLSIGGTNKWVIKSTGNGYSNICNTANQCLHVQYGTLQLGTIQSGWWSAMWKFESAGSGYNRIRNKWKSSYIHVQDSATPKAGTIQSGWWSAMWKNIAN